jgi:hypothetical protein
MAVTPRRLRVLRLLTCGLSFFYKRNDAAGIFLEMEGPSMTWHMLRAAAIVRHRLVWRACGRNPQTWPAHMRMIRAVYGY